MVKNLPTNAGDARGAGLILGLGRSPGVENGNPLQYSEGEFSMENSIDRRALWATYSPWGHKELDMTEHARTPYFKKTS